jgi:hypothetical protein
MDTMLLLLMVMLNTFGMVKAKIGYSTSIPIWQPIPEPFLLSLAVLMVFTSF